VSGSIALLLFLLSAAPALAQGCANCYTTAAAGGPQTARALRSGILVLLVPPVIIFAGIVLALWRWRTARSKTVSSQFQCFELSQTIDQDTAVACKSSVLEREAAQ
jgi:hypothetical protein